MTFYIEPFISILFVTIKTLRVSSLDTPSFDSPVVTGLGEGARQKILIRQVFNRCVIVWVRQGVLSCIPHLPYPGERPGNPGREFPKRFFYLVKKSWGKDGETPFVTRVLRTRYSKKNESIRINLRDLAWSQVCPRDPGILKSWIPGTSPVDSPGFTSKNMTSRNDPVQNMTRFLLLDFTVHLFCYWVFCFFPMTTVFLEADREGWKNHQF